MGADSGTGNSRDGNKTPYDGMVDGGNRNQRREGSGNRGRERKLTRFPVPVPTTFSRPDFCGAYPWNFGAMINYWMLQVSLQI